VHLIDGIPFIEINISIESALANTYFDFDYTSNTNIEILENATNEYLEKIITIYLYKISYEFNTDICGFKSKLANNYLTLEDFNKINWESIYPNSYYKINIQNNLNYNGLLIKD
jgi:spore germination protein KC